MKITYDKEANALYVRLTDGAHQVRAVRVSDDVTCDLDGEGRVVGIEILNASSFFEHPQNPSIELDHVAPRSS
jgi:uncharacterized protein YuzE